jgi:hypothetical protein
MGASLLAGDSACSLRKLQQREVHNEVCSGMCFDGSGPGIVSTPARSRPSAGSSGEPPVGLAAYHDKKHNACGDRTEEQQVSHQTSLFIDWKPVGQEVVRRRQRPEPRSADRWN